MGHRRIVSILQQFCNDHSRDVPGSFQGVLTLQVYNYFENFPEDSKIIKCLVCLTFGQTCLLSSLIDHHLEIGRYYLVRCFGCPSTTPLNILEFRVIDLVDLALVGSLVYKYLITDWGNLPALAFTTKETDLHITFDGLSSFLCQMFFIRRWECSACHVKQTLLTFLPEFGYLASETEPWQVSWQLVAWLHWRSVSPSQWSYLEVPFWQKTILQAQQLSLLRFCLWM